MIMIYTYIHTYIYIYIYIYMKIILGRPWIFSTLNVFTHTHTQTHTYIYIAKSAGAVEYTDCFYAEGEDPPQRVS